MHFSKEYFRWGANLLRSSGKKFCKNGHFFNFSFVLYNMKLIYDIILTIEIPIKIKPDFKKLYRAIRCLKCEEMK